MIIESTKTYLLSLTKTLLTSDIIISILSLFEMLPLFYHIILSSFSFSSHSPPFYFTKELSYLSYYSKLHTDYPSYIFFPLSIFLFFYLIFKYYLLRFKRLKNSILFRFIFINIYDFFKRTKKNRFI